MIKAKAILGCSLAVLIAGFAHAASHGSVYCRAGAPSIQFAGRVESDRRLLSGLSVWDRKGNNSFIQGKAEKRGDHWLYVADKAQYAPLDRPCRLEVWYSERAGVRAKADPQTGCANHGGWSEGDLAKKTYQGAVTVELDDPGNVFEDPPGLLGKGDCFKQNPK